MIIHTLIAMLLFFHIGGYFAFAACVLVYVLLQGPRLGYGTIGSCRARMGLLLSPLGIVIPYAIDFSVPGVNPFWVVFGPLFGPPLIFTTVLMFYLRSKAE